MKSYTVRVMLFNRDGREIKEYNVKAARNTAAFDQVDEMLDGMIGCRSGIEYYEILRVE